MNRTFIIATLSRCGKFKYISCYYESNKITNQSSLVDAFKYISCYYESANIGIGIDLNSKFKYISCYYESKELKKEKVQLEYLNTSLVTMNPY